jgi:hypothetical protein
MAHTKKPYYIPVGDYAFLAWAKNYHRVCTDNAALWGLPLPRLTAMGDAIAGFQVILDKCHSDLRTKADTASKNIQRKALKTDCRTFNLEYTQNSSKVSDDDRIRLQIPVRDVMRSNIPRPTVAPHFTLGLTNTTGQLALIIIDPVNGEEQIPYGMNGAVVYYAVRGPGEPVPATVEDLTVSELASASHYIIKSFKSGDEGKRVYVTLCWENEKGEQGPWSPIQSMILP